MSIKLFNRWESDHIQIQDEGLKRYIAFEAKVVPKTGARYAGQKFHKSKITVVERLMNKLMVSGHKARKHKFSSGRNTGKAHSIYKLMEDALLLVEKRTKMNPIEVLVRAVENAAPREEIITIEYGGARYPKAVEASPQRRIDLALRYMVQGVYADSFGKKKPAVSSLADEIIFASNNSASSNAIAKKFEVERQCDSSR
jgi:small subunit ribosomal protein S7